MEIGVKCYDYNLLENVHLYAEPPTKSGKTYLTQGDFKYFHYKCDGFDDIGWGCGYRSLQSICSWITHVFKLNDKDMPSSKTKITSLLSSSSSSSSLSPLLLHEVCSSDKAIPSLSEIQSVLVSISDKPKSFLNSREWIGALEVFYVIDTLYDVSCKILHIPQSNDIKKYSNIIKKYFEDFGGLIMMGGDIDASSKCLAGIHISGNQAYFLVIDPHFIGKVKSPQELVDKKYVRWQNTSQFIDSSFYNLCLPQIKAKHLK